MATEIVDDPLLPVTTQLKLLEEGQTLKTDEVTYGSARTLTRRVASETGRAFNVHRPRGEVFIYITRERVA